MSGVRRRALVFESAQRELVGIVEEPEQHGQRGIVFITGGPQYRVGSHRQFVLLARKFVDEGYPVFRFDYHGMGDSGGPLSDFTDAVDDVREAVRVFRQEAGVAEVVLWGLCDAASASLMCVAEGSPIAGLVLMNPWVRSDQGLARAHLRHYYVRRILSTDWLKELVAGELEIRSALTGFGRTLRGTLARQAPQPTGGQPQQAAPASLDFREAMLEGMTRFDGPVLLILSGEDLTASEFADYARRDRRWRKLLRRRTVTQRNLDNADHTFSRREWRNTVAGWTVTWLSDW